MIGNGNTFSNILQELNLANFTRDTFYTLLYFLYARLKTSVYNVNQNQIKETKGYVRSFLSPFSKNGNFRVECFSQEFFRESCFKISQVLNFQNFAN